MTTLDWVIFGLAWALIPGVLFVRAYRDHRYIKDLEKRWKIANQDLSAVQTSQLKEKPNA